MKSQHHDEIPNDKWGSERLGEFCVERRGRSALDTVLIGRAITLAKDRCKKEGKDFTSWKREYGFSDASVSRYMRLAKTCKTEEDLERLKAVGPLAAYIDAGIEAPREHKPRQPSVRKCENSSAVVKEEPKTPSWAVPDTDGFEDNQGDTDQIIELVPKKVCVEQELREVVPWQVSALKKKVTFLMEQDGDVLRAARPQKDCDRSRIANEISALVELLTRLATMLRDEPAPQADGNTKQRKEKAA